jgi:formylglycine-generating enzyme required for sulfatase activity
VISGSIFLWSYNLSDNMDYLDFDVEIREGDGHVYLVAARSLVGEGQVSATFPFTDAELEAQLLRLENAILRSAGRRGKALSEEERVVQLLGQQLFDFLLAGELRALYYECQREAAHRNQGVRLRLHVQPSHLSVLPWEFLYDPRREDYLCLDPYTPLVRYLDLAQSIPPLAVTPPLRILGMVASPCDLPAMDERQEKQRVERAMHRLSEHGDVELTWVAGQTWRDLQQVMRPGQGPWHVFHFIGHGGVDLARDEGFVMLANEQGQAQYISALQLGRLLAGQRYSLRLVILNACEGARGSGENVLSSTAATLVRSGLPAVLAMQYAITDAAAVEFARSFYEALAAGSPVDAAVADARNAISLRNESSLEWGTPVLYMRTADGKIFDVAASKPPPEPAVGEKAPLPQPIATTPPNQAATSPIQQPVSAVEAAALATTPKAEGQIQPQHGDEGSKPAQATRPPARKRGLSSIVLQLIGAAIVLSAGVVVIIFLQKNIDGAAPQLQPVTDRFDIRFVEVPAGAFKMGSPEGQGANNEQPQHDVFVDNIWMGLTEVTNAQYSHFVEAGGYTQRQWWTDAGWQWHIENDVTEPGHWQDEQWNRPDLPVVGVSWYEAIAYTRWLSHETKLTVRLPTEAEWERAACGEDERIYPWGDIPPNDQLLNYKSILGHTSTVGSYPDGASPYGALDIAGNVWEWTNSLYQGYPYQADDGREAPGGAGPRTLRGGSFNFSDDRIRCAARQDSLPLERVNDIGFRIVVSGF